MQKEPQLTKAVGKLDFKKRTRHLPQGLVTAFALAACGKETPAVIEPVSEPIVVSPDDILNPTLIAGANYTSPSNNTELISIKYVLPSNHLSHVCARPSARDASDTPSLSLG